MARSIRSRMPRLCRALSQRRASAVFFFFNDTATTEIYTLSLHDALPISGYPRSAAETGSGDHLCALRGSVVLATLTGPVRCCLCRFVIGFLFLTSKNLNHLHLPIHPYCFHQSSKA